MSVHLKNHEEAHRQLFGAHWDIVRATDKAHAVVMMMVDRERYKDERAALAPLIERLRTARDKLSEALHEIGNVRSDLMTATGCDGSCKMSSSEPEQVK